MIELPPLHPILVHFPVALLPIATLFDLLGRVRKNAALAHAGCFSLLAAAAVTPLTAASGWLWLRDIGEMAHGDMVIHQWLGTALPLLLIPLSVWRYRIHARATQPTKAFLAALIIVLGLVTFQGHIGGRMTFGAAAPLDAPPASPMQHSAGGEHSSTAPTTAASDDGWGDSIKVKGHHHE